MGRVDLSNYSKKAVELARSLEKVYSANKFDEYNLGSDSGNAKLFYLRRFSKATNKLDRLSFLSTDKDIKGEDGLRNDLAELLKIHLTDMKFDDLKDLPDEEQAYQIVLRKHDPRDLVLEYNKKCHKIYNNKNSHYLLKESVENGYLDVTSSANERVSQYLQYKFESKEDRLNHKYLLEREEFVPKENPKKGKMFDKIGSGREDLKKTYVRLRHMTKYMTVKELKDVYKSIMTSINKEKEDYRKLMQANKTKYSDFEDGIILDQMDAEIYRMQVIFTKIMSNRLHNAKTPNEILASDLNSEAIENGWGLQDKLVTLEDGVGVLDKLEMDEKGNKSFLGRIRDAVGKRKDRDITLGE